MSDMSEEQRAAARKALKPYPVRPELVREGDTSIITPIYGAKRGASVTIINKATPPSQIELELADACHTLVES